MHHGTPRRRLTRYVAIIALGTLGALVLSSCTTPARTSAPLLKGTPAYSISVPLSNVSCTQNDVCLATGTISTLSGPDNVAEYATPHGNWLNVPLPTAPSPIITTEACSLSGCLVGGSDQGHDLLWSLSTATHQLSPILAPSGGIGVINLSCNANNCTLIDSNSQAETRFSTSSNAGVTWSTPVNVSWPRSDAITTTACGSATTCAVGTLSASHVFTLYVTTNAGVSWLAQSTPSSWATMSSLTCRARQCVALAQTSGASLMVRSKNFANTWTTTPLSGRASALACTTLRSCVVVGQRSQGRAWLATVQKKSVTNVTLRYVPTPLVGVACGSAICAAIGATTVLAIPSSLQRRA